MGTIVICAIYLHFCYGSFDSPDNMYYTKNCMEQVGPHFIQGHMISSSIVFSTNKSDRTSIYTRLASHEDGYNLLEYIKSNHCYFIYSLIHILTLFSHSFIDLGKKVLISVPSLCRIESSFHHSITPLYSI